MVVLINREQFFPERERAIDDEKGSSDPNQLHKNLQRIIRTDVAGGLRKVVIKVSMVDDEAKQKVFFFFRGKQSNAKQKVTKAISVISGIDSLAVDMKEKKLTVIGEVDPIQVVSKLRQKKWFAEILTVGPAKEEAKKKETADLIKADQNYYPHYTHCRVMSMEENPVMTIDSVSVNGKHQKLTVIGDTDPIQVVSKLRNKGRYCEILKVGPAEEEEEALSSSVTQAARGKQKLVEEKAPLEDATVSNMRQLLKSTDISAQAEASTSRSVPFVEDPYTVMLDDRDRTKDVMVERKRLLDDQEMSINRIVELERLLATQKALLATERVVLEELIAKDEQLEELNRALEVEKKNENDYFRGVEDCRLKMLERYPELDLSWMNSEFGFKSMLGNINEVPASQEPFPEIRTVGPAKQEKNPEGKKKERRGQEGRRQEERLETRSYQGLSKLPSQLHPLQSCMTHEYGREP